MNNTAALRAKVSVLLQIHVDSLVRDDLEDQVVQQRELLSYLQGRVVLERLGLTVFHGLIHRHKRTDTVKGILTSKVQIISTGQEVRGFLL